MRCDFFQITVVAVQIQNLQSYTYGFQLDINPNDVIVAQDRDRTLDPKWELQSSYCLQGGITKIDTLVTNQCQNKKQLTVQFYYYQKGFMYVSGNNKAFAEENQISLNYLFSFFTTGDDFKIILQTSINQQLPTFTIKYDFNVNQIDIAELQDCKQGFPTKINSPSVNTKFESYALIIKTDTIFIWFRNSFLTCKCQLDKAIEKIYFQFEFSKSLQQAIDFHQQQYLNITEFNPGFSFSLSIRDGVIAGDGIEPHQNEILHVGIPVQVTFQTDTFKSPFYIHFSNSDVKNQIWISEVEVFCSNGETFQIEHELFQEFIHVENIKCSQLVACKIDLSNQRLFEGQFGRQYYTNNVQNIDGSPHNDWLGGNSLDNLINGGDGNDTIQVSEGNDHLDGGNGNNTLNCSILEAPIRISSKSLPGYQMQYKGFTSYFVNFQIMVDTNFDDNVEMQPPETIIFISRKGNDQLNIGMAIIDFSERTSKAIFYLQNLTLIFPDEWSSLTVNQGNIVILTEQKDIVYLPERYLVQGRNIGGRGGNDIINGSFSKQQLDLNLSSGLLLFLNNDIVNSNNQTEGSIHMWNFAILVGSPQNDYIELSSGIDQIIMWSLGNDTYQGNQGDNDTVDYSDSTNIGILYKDQFVSFLDFQQKISNIRNFIGTKFNDSVYIFDDIINPRSYSMLQGLNMYFIETDIQTIIEIHSIGRDILTILQNVRYVNITIYQKSKELVVIDLQNLYISQFKLELSSSIFKFTEVNQTQTLMEFTIIQQKEYASNLTLQNIFNICQENQTLESIKEEDIYSDWECQDVIKYCNDSNLLLPLCDQCKEGFFLLVQGTCKGSKYFYYKTQECGSQCKSCRQDENTCISCQNGQIPPQCLGQATQIECAEQCESCEGNKDNCFACKNKSDTPPLCNQTSIQCNQYCNCLSQQSECNTVRAEYNAFENNCYPDLFIEGICSFELIRRIKDGQENILSLNQKQYVGNMVKITTYISEDRFIYILKLLGFLALLIQFDQEIALITLFAYLVPIQVFVVEQALTSFIFPMTSNQFEYLSKNLTFLTLNVTESIQNQQEQMQFTLKRSNFSQSLLYNCPELCLVMVVYLLVFPVKIALLKLIRYFKRTSLLDRPTITEISNDSQQDQILVNQILSPPSFIEKLVHYFLVLKIEGNFCIIMLTIACVLTMFRYLIINDLLLSSSLTITLAVLVFGLYHYLYRHRFAQNLVRFTNILINRRNLEQEDNLFEQHDFEQERVDKEIIIKSNNLLKSYYGSLIGDLDVRRMLTLKFHQINLLKKIVTPIFVVSLYNNPLLAMILCLVLHFITTTIKFFLNPFHSKTKFIITTTADFLYLIAFCSKINDFDNQKRLISARSSLNLNFQNQMKRWSNGGWITVTFEITPTLLYIIWGILSQVIFLFQAIHTQRKTKLTEHDSQEYISLNKQRQQVGIDIQRIQEINLNQFQEYQSHLVKDQLRILFNCQRKKDYKNFEFSMKGELEIVNISNRTLTLECKSKDCEPIDSNHILLDNQSVCLDFSDKELCCKDQTVEILIKENKQVINIKLWVNEFQYYQIVVPTLDDLQIIEIRKSLFLKGLNVSKSLSKFVNLTKRCQLRRVFQYQEIVDFTKIEIPRMETGRQNQIQKVIIINRIVKIYLCLREQPDYSVEVFGLVKKDKDMKEDYVEKLKTNFLELLGHLIEE